MTWGINANPLAAGLAGGVISDISPAAFAGFDKMLGAVPIWGQARSIAGDAGRLTKLFGQIDGNAGTILQIGKEFGIENGPQVLKDGVGALMKGFSEGGASGLMGALKGVLAKCPNFLGFLTKVAKVVPGLGLIVSLAVSLPTLLNPHASPAQKTAALLSLASGVVSLVPGWGTAAALALNVGSMGVGAMQRPIDNVLTKVGTSMGVSINGFPAHMDFEREANELVAKFEREGNHFAPIKVQGGRFGMV